MINKNEIYNFKKESEKIKQEKQIFFYDNCFEENDNRRFSVSANDLKEIDRLEKKISEIINEKYNLEKRINEKIMEINKKKFKEESEKIMKINEKNPKDEYIKILSEILEHNIKKINNKNFIGISNYIFSLKLAILSNSIL